MSLIPFVVYLRETGFVLYRGLDSTGAAGQAPNLPPEQAALDVPVEALAGAELDLAPIRRVMGAKVDYGAETMRMTFLTPGGGQALTYAYKAEEARRWTADHSADTPFLTAEAAARDMTIAALVNDVLGAIGAWTVVGAAIEAERMRAKAAIQAADNLATLAQAAEIDWPAVVAATQPGANDG